MSQVFEQEYSAGFHVAENYAFKSEKGLSRKIVEQISDERRAGVDAQVPPQEPGTL